MREARSQGNVTVDIADELRRRYVEYDEVPASSSLDEAEASTTNAFDFGRAFRRLARCVGQRPDPTNSPAGGTALPLMAQAKTKLGSFHAQRCDGSLHLLRDFGNRRPILRMLLEAPQVSGGPFTTVLLLLVRTFQLVSS
jgi:hypothetical protein